MSNKNNITVLGCGNGGMALAADLKLKGANVALWSDPNHATKYNAIKETNSIILHEGQHKTKVQLDLVSLDLSEVIQFGTIIYNATPMMAHVALFNNVASHLPKHSPLKFFINLSGTFSAVDQYINAQDQTVFDHLKVFDTSTFPYACRAFEDNEVSIYGRKSELNIGPLIPSDIHFCDLLKESILPSPLIVHENSLKLGLIGTNAVFHPATVLFNARLIDNGNSFLFYKEGISKKTSLLHQALDDERLLLAKAMSYDLPPCIEDDNRHYGTNFKNSYDFSINSKVHNKIKSPTTLNHRFVTEDIAYGLVPLLALGKLYKVKLSRIKSVVNIFSTIMKTNYVKRGRNLAGLTLETLERLSSHDTCTRKLA